ncbi:hypothetical protein FHX37_0602 [Haloactinospora alba]|uniref:Prevent-host-death family protein n=1 Tax=Haloactinospora alba TaxID=405555 RepID=A0A543NG25_9ACTN|nr:hypothetical protein FHX37_0602 [Haloactinospora alba]
MEREEAVYVADDEYSEPYVAIVPVALVRHYESLLDQMEEQLLEERLVRLETGRSETLSADEAKQELGLV